jgi:dTDP-4-dehydrorhamnose reductase
MSTATILITGANGQLGNEFRVLATSYAAYRFVFITQEDASIDDAPALRSLFQQYQPAYCINCAAYTAVDKAESDAEQAFAINAKAVGALAALAHEYNTRFLHFSTDYVFDGTSQEPYNESAPVDPVNVYGASKLLGEELCMQHNPDAIIIRTAWVFSSFGQNFVKTMIRLMKERNEINVVNDQVGAPTYAADLAACIMTIIANWMPGIYHYSNSGRISWYNFADAIRELTGSNCIVNPISTSQFPTPAKRPSFSLLDTTKIRLTFGCSIPDWKDGLQRCLRLLGLHNTI